MFIPLVLSALINGAGAATLDLTLISPSGCDDQWNGDCLPNSVWGADDVLHVENSTTYPILTVGASSAYPTKVGLPTEVLGSGDDIIEYVVMGKALSAATTVEVETRLFDSSGVIISTHSEQVHSGSAGRFSVSWRSGILPAAAAAFKVRLVVDDAAALITVVKADSGTTDGAEPVCVDCSVDCGDYSAEGHDCDEQGCNATCDGVFGNGELVPAPGTELSP